MTEETFWGIIQESRKNFSPKRFNGNMDMQLKTLNGILNKLDSEELGQFDGIFCELAGRAYNYDLWACAFISDGGCSDDGFMDFRSWMISMGEDAFKSMIEDADNVANYCDQPGIECISFERVAYVANGIYTAKFDPEGIPDNYYDASRSTYPRKRFPTPTGKKWKPDNLNYFRSRFPRMWAKRCRISWPD